MEIHFSSSIEKRNFKHYDHEFKNSHEIHYFFFLVLSDVFCFFDFGPSSSSAELLSAAQGGPDGA